MRSWSPLQRILLVVAVGVFAVVGVLAVMALEPDQEECRTGTREVDDPVDRSPEDAIAEFVAANGDDYPLEGWEVASTDGGVTVFTNADDDGEYRLEVESGLVVFFERCDG